MSGFSVSDESEHDAFGAGHASTAISAALGMAVGRQLNHGDKDGRVVAIVGDGALNGRHGVRRAQQRRQSRTCRSSWC